MKELRRGNEGPPRIFIIRLRAGGSTRSRTTNSRDNNNNNNNNTGRPPHQDDGADVGGQQSVVPQGSSVTLRLHVGRTLVVELERRAEAEHQRVLLLLFNRPHSVDTHLY